MPRLSLNKGPGITARLVLLALSAVAIVWGLAVWQFSQSFGEMLRDNERLRQAISRLTSESDIGRLRVIDQQLSDGQLYTTLEFQPGSVDAMPPAAIQQLTLPGDEIHFDALVVTFDPQLVADGKGRAMYLWRRVYSDEMAPRDGLPLYLEDQIPPLYRELFAPRSWLDRLLLREDEEPRFWQAVWQLARDPDRLSQWGIRAVQGNAVYARLRTGDQFRFRFTATGQILLESLGSGDPSPVPQRAGITTPGD